MTHPWGVDYHLSSLFTSRTKYGCGCGCGCLWGNANVCIGGRWVNRKRKYNGSYFLQERLVSGNLVHEIFMFLLYRSEFPEWIHLPLLNMNMEPLVVPPLDSEKQANVSCRICRVGTNPSLDACVSVCAHARALCRPPLPPSHDSCPILFAHDRDVERYWVLIPGLMKTCYRSMGTTGDPIPSGHRNVPVNHFTGQSRYRW